MAWRFAATTVLRVDAIDIVPAALRRLALRFSSERIESTLVLNCGEESSDLTVISGRRLLLYRELSFSMQQTLEQLCTSLDLTENDVTAMISKYGIYRPDSAADAASEQSAAPAPSAAYEEITQTISQIAKPGFYAMAEHIDKAAIYTASKSRGSGIDRVYLLGPIARWPGAAELLGSLVSYPVQLLDIHELFPSERDHDAIVGLESDTELALAAGLALRGLGDG